MKSPFRWGYQAKVFAIAATILATLVLARTVEHLRRSTELLQITSPIAVSTPKDVEKPRCPDATISAVSYDRKGSRIRLRVKSLQSEGSGGISYVAVRLQCAGTNNTAVTAVVSLSGEPPSSKVILLEGQERDFSIAAPSDSVVETCKPEIMQCIYPFTE
jgi:hypothetical protein